VFQLLRQSLLVFVALTLVTGIAYPLLVTGVAQGLFRHQANGSLVERDGKVIGSSLIGQQFNEPRYFWGRPSATGPSPYNAAASTGSNYGPTNPAQLDAVRGRVDALKQAHPGASAGVPIDLVTASGSGLDPHISLAAAQFQVERVAQARGLTPAAVTDLVSNLREGRTFSLFGEPRVNVLKLNLTLDEMGSPAKER
jgi:potassium-transporting ATPase KdpC subunit